MTLHSHTTGSRRRLLAAALVVALAGVPALASRVVAQDAGPAKKVGTERIVVTPPAPAAPATPAAPAPTPAPAGTVAPATVPAQPTGPLPEVHKGEADLPPAVAKMRKRLLDAAYSGDMQRLKMVIQSNEMPPVFSVNEIGDPIDFLEKQSGDGKGLEILAILTDVLESSWVHVNAGKPQDMYVWPSYAALPVDKLEPAQLVELYKIVTSSDFEEMKGSGRYTFYSVGIGPDGTWHWFRPAD